ncbi:hypothetical protein [Thalassobaculum sp.]|uniref:hypothetical protein n=1 Tax=Thalassobaculum sp. TaxID=2022740 RepID=UPI0032EFCEAC
MRRLSALACACLTVAGCAGRDPIPVSAYMPNDAGLKCSEIDAEIVSNNAGLKARVNESVDTRDKNILIGAAAVLLFLPAAFAMDLKGAASTEATALEARNRTLTMLGAKQRCRTTRAMTVAEAEAERVTSIQSAEASQPADVPGVRTPTDQRLHPAPSATQMSAAPAGVDRAQLQTLMDRFLRGEITKAEYDQLRAG